MPKCRLISLMLGILILGLPCAAVASEQPQDLQEEFNERLRDSNNHNECELKHAHLHSALVTKTLQNIESVVGAKITKFKDSTPADDAYVKFANGAICSLRLHEGHRADEPQMSFIKVVFSHCLDKGNHQFEIQSQIPEIEGRLVCP